MTTDPQTDRTPYCHKIRYGITGAPILTEDEMDGSHAPGIGVSPSLIELVYSAARDGKPASVSASVTGSWTRFGEPADGQVAVHFKDGPDGWPEWLAEEARLHDPAAVPSAPVARAAVLREAADKLSVGCPDHGPNGGWLMTCQCEAIGVLRDLAAELVDDSPSRVADEEQQPKTQRRRCPACGHFICDGAGPCGAIVSLSAVSDEKRCTCTGPAAVAQPGKEA